MAPILWEVLTLTANMSEDPEEHACLLRPQSGILPHIRYINIVRLYGSLCCEADHVLDSNLRLLLCALPRNRLRGFECVIPIKPWTVQLLLHSQQQIETLDVELSHVNHYERSISGYILCFPHSITSALSNITSLTVGMAPEKQTELHSLACKFAKIIITQCPLLENLQVCNGDERRRNEALRLVSIDNFADILGTDLQNGMPKFPNLTALSLVELGLSIRSKDLVTYLDVSKLRSLTLRHCNNLRPLLQRLTDAFRTHACALQELAIQATCAVDARAVQVFLGTFRGLSSLLLDMDYVGLGDAVDGIIRHGQTLHTFSILTNGRKYTTAMEIKRIADGCPNLKRLGFNTCPINMGHVDKMGSSFSLQQSLNPTVQSELEATLQAVAKLRRLHTFRLFTSVSMNMENLNEVIEWNSGDIREHWVPAFQGAMQHFATHVFHYWVLQGSSVKTLLAWPSPSSDFLRLREPDGNGHFWPYYAYVRERGIDIMGREWVNALPITTVQVQKELPGSIFGPQYI